MTILQLTIDDLLTIHHSLHLALVIRLAQRLPFVVAVLALAEGYLQFGEAIVIDEHPQRDDRLAGVLGGLLEFAQFALVQQQFTVTKNIMVGVTAELILGYMHLLGEELRADKLAVGVSQACLRLTDRLDLRTAKLDAGSISLQYLVVERSPAVLDIYLAF